MNTAELVNALRFCADADSGSGCAGCTVDDGEDCCGRLLRDTADALEAQQKALGECAKQLADMAAKCHQLEAQLPKEGEWIELTDRAERKYSHICSNCHRFNIHEGEIEFYHYCPNCGARMKGEQE